MSTPSAPARTEPTYPEAYGEIGISFVIEAAAAVGGTVVVGREGSPSVDVLYDEDNRTDPTKSRLSYPGQTVGGVIEFVIENDEILMVQIGDERTGVYEFIQGEIGRASSAADGDGSVDAPTQALYREFLEQQRRLDAAAEAAEADTTDEDSSDE